MEEAKKKILSDLYAIRATMSLMAENGLRSASNFSDVHNTKLKIEDCERNISKLQSQCESDTAPYLISEEILLLSREKAKEEEKLNKNEKEFQKQLSDWKYHFGPRGIFRLIAIYFAMLIGAVPISFGPTANAISEWGVNKWLILAFSLVATLSLIGFSIYFLAKIRPHLKSKQIARNFQIAAEENKKVIKRLINRINAYNYSISQGKIYWDNEQVAEIKNIAENNISEIKKQIAELEATIPKYKEQIKLIAQNSKVIIDGAMEAYPLIDYRDWENVDLLIYYFETGRADDIKEALQLVDRQRQTDQISQALLVAAQAICKTVHVSMTMLGNTFTKALDKLSYRLSVQQNELLNSMQAQSESMKQAMSDNLSEQLKSQKMTQALLDRINISSGKLAEMTERQMREVYNIT